MSDVNGKLENYDRNQSSGFTTRYVGVWLPEACTTNQIARRLNIHWLTAQKYATAEGFPERAKPQGDRSPIDIYLPYVRRRWKKGVIDLKTFWLKSKREATRAMAMGCNVF